MEFTSAPSIVVWNEGVHEARNEPATIGEMYPQGIHGAIAASLAGYFPGSEVSTATLADPGHGLTEERLADARREIESLPDRSGLVNREAGYDRLQDRVARYR